MAGEEWHGGVILGAGGDSWIKKTTIEREERPKKINRRSFLKQNAQIAMIFFDSLFLIAPTTEKEGSREQQTRQKRGAYIEVMVVAEALYRTQAAR